MDVPQSKPVPFVMRWSNFVPVFDLRLAAFCLTYDEQLLQYIYSYEKALRTGESLRGAFSFPYLVLQSVHVYHFVFS